MGSKLAHGRKHRVGMNRGQSRADTTKGASSHSAARGAAHLVQIELALRPRPDLPSGTDGQNRASSAMAARASSRWSPRYFSTLEPRVARLTFAQCP